MPEINTEVRTFETKYICDSCGVGEMKFTGEVLASYPPQYIHKCLNCSQVGIYRDKKYPKIHYVAALTNS